MRNTPIEPSIYLTAASSKRSTCRMPSARSGRADSNCRTFEERKRMFRDLRYALRVLTKSPGFTLAVILTLALGIAATTAAFSVFDAILLRPFSWHEPDRLVRVFSADRNRKTDAYWTSTISYPDLGHTVSQSTTSSTTPHSLPL